MTGVPIPALTAYDNAMQQFMIDRSITAGALAVMKNGVIVFEHGDGANHNGPARSCCRSSCVSREFRVGAVLPQRVMGSN